MGSRAGTCHLLLKVLLPVEETAWLRRRPADALEITVCAQAGSRPRGAGHRPGPCQGEGKEPSPVPPHPSLPPPLNRSAPLSLSVTMNRGPRGRRDPVEPVLSSMAQIPPRSGHAREGTHQDHSHSWNQQQPCPLKANMTGVADDFLALSKCRTLLGPRTR
ncbi:hypothetical protein SKAU_G00385630 [Synaphobranchus kaupii]|uniref:Uncharacterized protein n=1 Tax=Synaphobranchus kaupii TaxID=118154 RepID=A0A9Q1EEI8_SYNKA|nr:hypothetical protein SKAU_G00385630 [Synaphobranchus kaupii]